MSCERRKGSAKVEAPGLKGLKDFAMKININSPLASCAVPVSGQLSPYQAIGLVTDLAMNHSYYGNVTVKEILDRLIPALNTGNAKVFFDEDSRPYGYVSWASLSDDTHQSLLANDQEWCIGADQFFNSCPGSNLWFFDIISPFSSPLTLFRQLKQALHSYDNAYLAAAPNMTTSHIRRVW
jgi:cytolysin-activating lysine-acyltransferase